jgi:hypothetical protein
MIGEEGDAISPSDHHHEYLARTVAALTPAGLARVESILEELAEAGASHRWLARFAVARESEAEGGRLLERDPEPADMLTGRELDELVVGFRTIRDQEPLDDVGDWANAVLALLKDEKHRRRA